MKKYLNVLIKVIAVANLGFGVAYVLGYYEPSVFSVASNYAVVTLALLSIKVKEQ